MAKDSSAEGHAGTSTSGTAGGEGSMPGMGDLWAMMRDTLWEILPEILGDRTASEGTPKEPHPSGKTWTGKSGRMVVEGVQTVG